MSDDINNSELGTEPEAPAADEQPVPAETAAEETSAAAEETSAVAEEASEETPEETPAEEKPKKKKSSVRTLVIGLVAVLLAFAAGIGYKSFKAGEFSLPFSKSASESSVGIQELNYEKLYKTRKADSVAIVIGGEPINWSSYFTWVYNMGEQVVSYMQQMYMYYGLESSWDEAINDAGDTYFTAVSQGAEDSLKQLICIERFAESLGIALDEADQAEIAAAVENAKISSVGADATDEQFREHLKSFYIDLDFYERNVGQSILYTKCYNSLYGEDLSLVSEEDALKLLEEGGYIHAAHILFNKTDPATGEQRSEEVMAEKLAQLESIAEELRGISGSAKRVDTFFKYMKELSEDTGMMYYTDGYTFTEGTMVPEFEQACKALSDYEVCDPVETDYGYHIIIRLPLDADGIIDIDPSTGTATTAISVLADTDFSARLQALFDALDVKYENGVGEIKFSKYLRPIETK